MNIFFLNIMWRSLFRRGVFPIINILGLSIGLAVVLLISLLVFNERSFNKQFKENKNIYRINSNFTGLRTGETYCTTANAVGPAMNEAIPEVLAAVRIYPASFVVRIDEHLMRINVMWADADFFKLFDTPFLLGTPQAVMSRPNAIAISEQMAKTLFGTGDPLGETFSLNDEFLMEVAAVYRDYPANSSFREFKMIAPLMYSFPSWLNEQVNWGRLDFETFCLLSTNADTALVNAKMHKTTSDATNENWFFRPELQSLEEIHLYSTTYRFSNTSSQSDIGKIKMLSLLAMIILVVACINYMNLSTARAQKRSKEIGLNKTLGAKRYELMFRLLLETGILTFLSFVLAFLLAWALLPVFNNLLGEQLRFGLALKPAFLCIALSIWLITTIVTASYPALYLSAFPPLLAIGSGFMPKSSHANVRKILSVGQFAVAVVLIVWVLIVQVQIKYINNKDLGYNPHNLIGLELVSLPQNSNLTALANDLRAQSSVEMTSRKSGFLFFSQGAILMKNADDQVGASLRSMAVDTDFIELMQMKLIAGRPLPEKQSGDTVTQIILNRAAVEYLEMTPEEAIGKIVFANIGEGVTQVCGIVENFNFRSLHQPISSFCFHNGENMQKSVIMLRVKEGNLSQQLAIYEQIVKNHFPNELFEPQFVDMQLAKAYDGERRTSQVALIFSALAILVACMGVFGLTAFMAEQRTKEIGVRKVLGASIMSIVSLFTVNYIKLLLISLVIAVPAAWWVGERYLQNFVYRISLSWWIFAAAALITVALTLLTVCALAVKSALADPVKSLKKE